LHCLNFLDSVDHFLECRIDREHGTAYDHGAMGEAIHRGLLMAPEQRRERMHLMRAMVSENNVYFWAGRMLLEAARLRKRRHIEEQIDRVTAPFGRRSRGNAG
jgi:hypothetical protein